MSDGGSKNFEWLICELGKGMREEGLKDSTTVPR